MAHTTQPESSANTFFNVYNYILYNFILILALPLLACLLLLRFLSGKARVGGRERWGHLPTAMRRRDAGATRVWIHAVSAGEVVAAAPILRELRALLPNAEMLLSVITPAGHEMAEQQARPYVDAVFYAPFDLPWVTARVVRYLRPDVFVSLESELWPNLLYTLKRSGCATIMVNGRISDRNYSRASRIGGPLFRWMLSNVDMLLMQSERDAERIRALGRLIDPARVIVVGNSKFDQEVTSLGQFELQALREQLHLPTSALVLVAGSTRSSEEEAEVVSAYAAMRLQFPDLCLIIAPRHIERAAGLAEAMRGAGLSPVRRTEVAAARDVSHLILDTIGELVKVYAAADIAFVGNSFEPVTKGGGQNLLQPLAHGKPVLFGPRTATTRAETALAIDAGVGFRVANAAEMAEVGIRLLGDMAARAEISKRALRLIAANQGVSARYAAVVVNISERPNRWTPGRTGRRPQQACARRGSRHTGTQGK